MASTTFTLRLAPNDHDLLVALAKVRNQTVADLTRQLLYDGINRLLDPTEIDKAIEIERTRLKETAAELRERAQNAGSEILARSPSAEESPGHEPAAASTDEDDSPSLEASDPAVSKV